MSLPISNRKIIVVKKPSELDNILNEFFTIFCEVVIAKDNASRQHSIESRSTYKPSQYEEVIFEGLAKNFQYNH